MEGAAIEAAKGTATPTIQSATEEAYILFLFGYVVVIFLGGLVLAGSAFKIFPDNIERWVSETLYPAYSPTVIGFLVFSSVYGLVKTQERPQLGGGQVMSTLVRRGRPRDERGEAHPWDVRSGVYVIETPTSRL